MSFLCGWFATWVDARLAARIAQLTNEIEIANMRILVLERTVEEQAAALARNLKRTEAESAYYASQIAEHTK